MMRLALLLLALPVVGGELLLGLSLTQSGSSHEVQKAKVIQQALELVVSRANENAFTQRGFRDHLGNPLLFGLRIFDDEGSPSKVQQIYTSMIQDRLVDILLGPQTQLLSEAARLVTTSMQRTLMLWSLHTMTVDNLTLQSGQPGTFSVAVPGENMMQEGLRILHSLGSRHLGVIIGTDRVSEFMCRHAISAALAMGYAEQHMIIARPQSSYELLIAMQRHFTRNPEVLLTCTNEAEVLNVIMIASRLNVTAQAMLSWNANSLSSYNIAGPAISKLLAPDAWHYNLSYPCRLFLNTETFVSIYRFRYGQAPSSDAASAAAAAITVMATLQQTVFEGPELEKNVRLAAALRLAVVETSYGRISFNADGSCNQMAVTVQIEEVEGGAGGFDSVLLDSNLTNLVWPMPSWDSKNHRELECPKGTIYNAFVTNNGTENCLLCPAGFTNAPKGEWCQECYAGTSARNPGSECSPCPRGADCVEAGTTTPGSLPGFYRFDADPAGVLHFVECRQGLCLGNNECQGSNTGALCQGCLAGTTNSGILRKNAQCTNCLPTPVLVIILIIYFLVLYFFVVIIASATIHGMIWKRILSYWQICSAATHVGRLYHADGVLQLVSDVILYPFHSLVGPDCLFAGTAGAETFVFATGVALMPCICALSTVFFIIKTGIQISINSQKDKRTRGQKKIPIKELFIRTFQGATRWNVATLIVLYCPTLIIFMTCCSFVQYDVLRMRYWLEVPLSQAAFFAMFSAGAGVIQGLAIPTVLFFILRRLNKRNLLKDPVWHSVLGMLYNDFEPEYWWYEIDFFVKKFLFMASTAIPDEVLRIFVFAALSFVHLQSLTLAKPFSAMDGNILQKMEICFIFSLYSILTAQILLIWYSSGAIEIFAVILVYFAHVLFSVVACRSLLVALVYRPLTLKAMAMPQVMNWLEKLICNSESISRISWDSVRQRLIFTSVNRSGRWKLLETLISELHRYVEKADEFHPSYLSVAIDQAFHHCVQQRRDLLIADHPRMLAQERKPGCLGCLIYWFPALPGSSKPAEGIELAKQQRLDRRSLNAVLPLVSTNSASIDEIQEAFIDYAFHEIILQNPDFFQKKDTPAELRYGAPKGVKEQKKRKSNIFLMKQSSGESERLEPQEEVSIEVKPKLSEEQMLAELPLLLAEAEELRAERDELLKRLEEKEEDIEWLQEIIEQDEAEEVTKPAEAPQVAPISVEQRPELEDVAIDAGGSRLCRC